MTPRSSRVRRSEAGVSLVELMVAMTLMIAIVPIVGSVMISTLSTGSANEEQSRTIDEFRGQLYAITRELRSATCIQTPSVANVAGNTLLFTTTSETTSGTSLPHDVKYEAIVDSSGGRLVRTDVATGGQRYVGPGLVQPNSTFTMRSTPRRSIEIVLRIQFSSKRSIQTLSTTITGRNAWATC